MTRPPRRSGSAHALRPGTIRASPGERRPEPSEPDAQTGRPWWTVAASGTPVSGRRSRCTGNASRRPERTSLHRNGLEPPPSTSAAAIRYCALPPEVTEAVEVTAAAGALYSASVSRVKPKNQVARKPAR